MNYLGGSTQVRVIIDFFLLLIAEHASNARIAARLIHRQIAHLNNVNANNTENKITLPESSEHQILNSEEEPTQSNWEYERDIKCVILDASLPFVPIHGWTKGALIAGTLCLICDILWK